MESIVPQFFSEWTRASSLVLWSWVSVTSVPSPLSASSMVTVW